jgi:hypothetical protein
MGSKDEQQAGIFGEGMPGTGGDVRYEEDEDVSGHSSDDGPDSIGKKIDPPFPSAKVTEGDEDTAGHWTKNPRLPGAEGEGWTKNPRLPGAEGEGWTKNPRLPGAEGDEDTEGHWGKNPRLPSNDSGDEFGKTTNPRNPSATGSDEDTEGHWTKNPRLPGAEGEGWTKNPRLPGAKATDDEDTEGHWTKNPRLPGAKATDDEGEFAKRAPDQNPHGER